MSDGSFVTAGYQRALDADPHLQAAVDVVDALCALVRPGETMCVGCVWEQILKPMVSPWIGWGRGYPPRQARDPGTSSWTPVSLAEFLAEADDRPTSENDTERWLRTSEAFDAFIDPLLARLDAADPGHGHGVRRGHSTQGG